MKLSGQSVLHLKAHLRFHFRDGPLGVKVDGLLVGAIESVPEGTLKLHLRMH